MKLECKMSKSKSGSWSFYMIYFYWCGCEVAFKLINVYGVYLKLSNIHECNSKFTYVSGVAFYGNVRNFLEHSYASNSVEYQLRAVVLLVCKCIGWARQFKHCAMKSKLLFYSIISTFLGSWNVNCFSYSEFYLGLCVLLKCFFILYTMYILKMVIPYAI